LRSILSVLLLLHVVDDPSDMIVVELGATVLTAELDHVRTFFTFNFQDFGCHLASYRSRDFVFLEKLSEIFLHLGRVDRALNSVCNLPDMVINGQVVDDFSALNDVGKPVEEVRSCDVCVHKLAAWDVLGAHVSVESERNDVPFVYLCLAKGPHTVGLAIGLGSTSHSLTRTSAVLQAGHGHRLAVLRLPAQSHVFPGIVSGQSLIHHPWVHKKVRVARSHQWVWVKHCVHQALEVFSQVAAAVTRVVRIFV